jgi:two-component system chemotaxis sensor kinase CheA
MALDLAKFAKAFYEEAQEHLSAMEAILVTAEAAGPGDDALHALFRAAHSVKGGAAAFGHAALSAFTHDLETLLDPIRKGARALDPALVTLLLWSVDMMRAHVAALDREVAPDERAMREIQEAVRAACAGVAPSPVKRRKFSSRTRKTTRRISASSRRRPQSRPARRRR